MQLPIVGFAGYGRTGKDTALTLLNDMLEKNNMTRHVRVSLAGPGKGDLDPIMKRLKSIPQFNDLPEAEKKQKLRPLYETYMTDLIRDLDEDYWVKCADMEMKYAEANCGEHRPLLWAISDIRYLNELRYVLGKGGSVFIIRKPNEFSKGKREQEGMDKIFHALTSGKLPHDRVHVVINSGSLDDLQKTVFDLYLQDCIAEAGLPAAAVEAKRMLRKKNGTA